MIVEVGDEELSIGQVAQSTWRVEILEEVGRIEAALPDELSLWREDLHPMVAGVGDGDRVMGVGGHAPRIVEVADGTSPVAKLQQELSVLVEHLHPMIVLVGDDDVVQRVRRDAGRPVELSRAVSAGAELCQKVAVLVEDLHSIVATIGDDDTPPLIDTDTPRTAELTVAGSLFSERQNRTLVGDLVVVAAATHLHRRWTIVDGRSLDEDVQVVGALDRWEVRDGDDSVFTWCHSNLQWHSVRSDDEGLNVGSWHRLFEMGMWCLMWEQRLIRWLCGGDRR